MTSQVGAQGQTAHAVADDGVIERSKVAEAFARYGIDTNKPNPMTV